MQFFFIYSHSDESIRGNVGVQCLAQGILDMWIWEVRDPTANPLNGRLTTPLSERQLPPPSSQPLKLLWEACSHPWLHFPPPPPSPPPAVTSTVSFTVNHVQRQQRAVDTGMAWRLYAVSPWVLKLCPPRLCGEHHVFRMRQIPLRVSELLKTLCLTAVQKISIPTAQRITDLWHSLHRIYPHLDQLTLWRLCVFHFSRLTPLVEKLTAIKLDFTALCVRQSGQQYWGPTEDCPLFIPLCSLYHRLPLLHSDLLLSYIFRWLSCSWMDQSPGLWWTTSSRGVNTTICSMAKTKDHVMDLRKIRSPSNSVSIWGFSVEMVNYQKHHWQ